MHAAPGMGCRGWMWVRELQEESERNKRKNPTVFEEVHVHWHVVAGGRGARMRVMHSLDKAFVSMIEANDCLKTWINRPDSKLAINILTH